MRPELAGALIRLARLEKNWSQEGLCRGICSISWLSKIEAGREGADPELVAALFARLGLETDETPEAAELIERCYEAAFALDYERWDSLRAELGAAALEKGPYCVDAALLGRLFSEEKGAPDWVRAMEDEMCIRDRDILDGRLPEPWDGSDLFPERSDFVRVWRWPVSYTHLARETRRRPWRAGPGRPP